jgi:hypothetical protein
MRRIGPDKINPRLRQIERFLDRLPGEMHDEFVKQTPIRTGNAKKSTELKRSEIQGNYAYANRLNKGWSSQAPQGMTDPTVEFARTKLRGLK